MIIRAEDIPETLQTPRPLSLRRFINVEEHSSQISMTWVHIWGHHDRIVNANCDRVYYILDGEGTFQVGEGAPIETVIAGDVVFIEHGTPYEFEGHMRYIVMNGPAFTVGSDEVLPPQFSSQTQGG
jgi:mannose-6-phosphate isomerase-like protein (cupin superfamily)